MPAPTVVAFDLMDTVVRDPFPEAVEAASGWTMQEAVAAREPGAFPAFERGDISEREYWAAYRSGGVQVETGVFHRARRRGYTWIPGMRELLADLDGRVLRVAASNYPVWIEELSDRMLIGWFDRILASHHLGARKPARDFYQRLLAELDVEAGQVLFVDDREPNVAGAAEAGLRSHRFAGAADLRQRLRAEGVEV